LFIEAKSIGLSYTSTVHAPLTVGAQASSSAAVAGLSGVYVQAPLSAATQEIASPGTSWLAQSGGTRLHTQPVADGAVPMQVVGPGL
jgi:hypothetical protein